MPREVASKNSSQGVKRITIPKEMEQDFPAMGFISRKRINTILGGRCAPTWCPRARAYGCERLRRAVQLKPLS